MTKLLPLFVILLVLPLLAVGLILIVRRSKTNAKISNGLLLSGIGGAIVTALFAYSRSTAPIAPFETGPGAWLPLMWQSLLALYIGFGLGVTAAGIAISPLLLVRSIKAWISEKP